MIDSLIDFRLVYMRLLAESWVDESFKTKLLQAEDIMELLRADSSKPYYYDSPWEYIKVKLIASDYIKWLPMETAGWISPDDYFIINIPSRPDHDQRVQALAAYYQHFPTFLGKTKQRKDGHNESFNSAIADLGIDPTPFLEFGGITLRTIALAWHNPGFLGELTMAGKDATPVLSKYFGFNNTWNFNLQFVEASKFKWEEKNQEWENIPQNIVMMHYPPKPEEEIYWPIALTAYNNTGPAYPFTC